MGLNEAVQDYYDQRAPRYKASTWRAHESQVEAFRGWVSKPSELGPNCPLADVDERTMVRYFNRLRPPVLSGSSFNNYRQYLMMFFRFCVAEGWLPRNPMRHVDPAPVIRRPRLQLSAQELLAVLDGAEPRDRVALSLGMNTALRAGDIMSLTVGSVNLSNNELTAFIQKNQKFDVLPICAELREELLRWFKSYAEAEGLTDWESELPNEWILVPPMQFQATNVWKPALGGQCVYKTGSVYSHPETIVQRALARLGYPTRSEGFHTLRRSTARRFYDLALEEGIPDPIRMSQALLGHQRRNTTEIYLGLTVEKEMRDDLLRGKSFLRRVADAEIRDRDGRNEGDEGESLAAAN